MSNSPTAKDGAEFMKEQLDRAGLLPQDYAVHQIENTFGRQFVCTNENGNPAIAPKVLREFRKITPDVVWERRERRWRPRWPGDQPGRSQQ